MSDPKPTSVRSGMSGFTLIELMISLTIGALVLAAATGLMVTAAEARNSVKHTTELQEEAFFISHVLKQQLAQIGFRNIGPLSGITRAMPIASKNTAYPFESGEWENGQVIKLDSNGFSYRFEGASLASGVADGSVYDCLGTAVPAGTSVVATVELQSDQLLCTVGTNNAILIPGGTGVSIEQLIIQLGVDTANSGTIDRVVDSTTATTSDYLNARHVTIRMLLASRDNIVKYNKDYHFNGTDLTASDKRLRTEAVVSVALRN